MRISGSVAELIVTHSTTATEAVKKATNGIPIVTAVVDPVVGGFAASLGHPGGNITGLSQNAVELSPKYLELLKVITPNLSRVAVLSNSKNSSSPAMVTAVENCRQGAKADGAPAEREHCGRD